MSVALLVVVVLALVTAGILLVLAVATFRQMRMLMASLKRFQEEVQPAATEIQAASMKAQDHLERLQQEPERPGQEAGGRIRR